MKPKTLNQRAALILKRTFRLPKEIHDDDVDYIRTGWFHAGYRHGFRAAQRKARKSK